MRTLIGGLALTSASVFTAVLLVSYCGALFTKQCSCFFYQKWQSVLVTETSLGSSLITTIKHRSFLKEPPGCR